MRYNYGGFIGASVDPSADGASGLWNSEDYLRQQRLASWPRRRRLDVLLLAGGGGGAGRRHAGGGGAGGLLIRAVEASPGTYTITIGAGGSGGQATSFPQNVGNAGSNTTAFHVTAIGGGPGRSENQGYGNGTGDGGSGGGNTTTSNDIWNSPTSDSGLPGGRGIPGQGNNALGSGGGGAGGAGKIADDLGSYTDRRGGKGVNLLIVGFSGVSEWVAGGGGGGGNTAAAAGGSGGSSVGGNGGTWNASLNGGNGATSTGSGGGGAASNPSDTPGSGGNGSGGMVIIRYTDGTVTATGGTQSTFTFRGVSYRVHRFTSTGNFTIS